ncbi:MAG TPA: transcription-repair coupling factor [Candidatus Dormibacteraeota bacterium]|jgi:transcription-repair coupling factor (superfamily II helicase)
MSTLWESTVGAAPKLERWLGSAPSELTVGRLPRSAWAIVAGSLARACHERGTPLLVLVPGPDRFADELRPWLAGRPATHVFAEVAVSFLDRPPASDEAVNKRLEALAALAGADHSPGVVISSRRAIVRMTLSPAELAQGTLVLEPGRGPDPVAVGRRLVELGYSREALVEARGQFSVRGGILDVFPAAADAPARAEWSGDMVETLRLFDPENQRSVMAIPQVSIRTGRELLLGPRRGAEAVARLRAQVPLDGLRADVRADWEDELVRLEAGSAYPGIEFYSSYLDPARPSLLDHLPADIVIVDFEADRQLADARSLIAETEMLAAAEASGGELPRGFNLPIVTFDRLNDFAGRHRLKLSAGEVDGEALDLGWVEMEPFVGRPRALAETAALADSATVVMATEQPERLEALLDESKVKARPTDVDLDLDLDLKPGLFHADVDLATGTSQPGIAFYLATDAELFGRQRRPSRRGARSAATRARDLTREFTLDFAPDELVVHVDHGIARFKGMRLIETDGAHREYLELEYAEGDRLFVPVENLDRVQKYLGGESEPTLHKLGTGDWTRARGRAKKVVQDVAEDLLRIYSLREARPGIAFAPDTAWQQELEASFPYEETPDQVAALAEIKADMESDRPMDRLLCGDVGFGKTELALRAAFKAAMSGKQVALLAPTTVLAQQHFHVFRERLSKFPVAVEMLSRFVDDETQARTIEGLKAGQVDIVVGTHRLLQRDVRFKRLGLLIVDEEHRFGVMQKERLKKLRTQLDVLSLSATPIPRTLHMAVGGIRDMSVIQTPPEERQPIKTYVTADDDSLIKEAITRELQRGGQVYFVHNRVRTIEKAADRVRDLVPEARVTVGHGQMAEDQLAEVMVAFESANFDVLVCTTIIESGLDIPNVNTIIVERSDRFGLAQLYQLRGRVGRSGRRAYAYFLYDPRRSLTERADKRLDVISGLHELGQGFKIALRDLEIRGAGNLLGTEQHGAIAAVGFEMYLQMLQSAVAKMRAGSEETAVSDVLSTTEMNLDLPLDHFIPRSYIRDEKLRLGAYRQLAGTEEEQELEAVLRSLEDRYGPGPKQLDNLAYSLRIKLRGQRLGLKGVVAEGHDIVVRVDPQRFMDVDELVRRLAGRIAIAPNRIKMRRQGEGWQDDLLMLLDEMAQLYESGRGVAAVPGV